MSGKPLGSAQTAPGDIAGTQGACAGLLCDNCTNPGRCCTGFNLPIADEVETTLEALVAMATVVVGTKNGRCVRVGSWTAMPRDWLDSAEVGLPFLPLQRFAGKWRWWCPHLVKGRCGIYQARPTLCRQYQAGSDRLCCMSPPAPSLSPQEAAGALA